METLETSETLGSGQDQNPFDRTPEAASGLPSWSEECSGLVLAAEVSTKVNGGGTDVSGGKDMGICSDINDVGKRVEGVEGGSLIINENECFGGIEKGFLVDEAVADESQMKVVSLESDFEGKRLIVSQRSVMGNGDVFIAEVCSTGNGNEEIEVEKVLTQEDVEEGDNSPLDGVDSCRKVEASQNGISLFVEVFGPIDGFIQGDNSHCFDGRVLLESNFNQENVCKGNGALLPNNGENTSAKVSENFDSMLDVTKLDFADGKAKIRNEVEEEAIGIQECRFSVGDLVWAKTKTQSWWPGQINDPSDAAKSDQKDSLLVKYFGNGSCIWCSSSQLKPFLENFEQLSRQSNSKSFLGAVGKAVGEIGRRVKMDMMCTCHSKESRTTLAVGTKEGDAMSEENMGELGEFSLSRFEPANFLAFIKDLAQEVSVPGKIEFTVIQNRLSAFYHAIGHCQLPMHQLRPTTDAKDSAHDGLASGISVGTVLEKTEEDVAKLFGGDRDVVLQKSWSNVADEGITSCNLALKNGESNQDSRDCGDEAEDVGVCKMASSEVQMISPARSSKSTESKFSCEENGDGGTDEKSESRERRKSKYLSPPYINNLNFGHKSSPTSGEHESQDLKAVSYVGADMNSTAVQSMESTPMVKCSGKKSQKKWSRKPFTGHDIFGKLERINASLVELLSEIRFTSLDCLYPNKSRHFDLAESFFSGFRKFAFRDDFSCEIGKEYSAGQKSDHGIHFLQTLPGVEVQMEKGKGIEEVTVEHWGAQLAGGAPDVNKTADHPGSAGRDPREMNHPLLQVVPRKRGRKRKEETTSVGLKTKHTAGLSDMKGILTTSGPVVIDFQKMGPPAPEGQSVLKRRKKAGTIPGLLQFEAMAGMPGLSDMKGNVTAGGSVIIDFQKMGPPRPDAQSVPKKRKKKEGATPGLWQAEAIAGLPDLNGNSTGLLFGDLQVTDPVATQGKPEPKKRKGKVRTASNRSNIERIAGLPDVNRSSAKLGPMLKDVQVMGLYSLQSIPELNNGEGMKEAASLLLNTELVANQPDVNGNNEDPGSFVKDPQEMCFFSPGIKLEPKKKKRQENTSGCQTEVTSAIPDLNGNAAEPGSLGIMLPETNCILPEGKPRRKRRRRNKGAAGVSDIRAGEALRTVILKFAPGLPMPSKEALVSTFCGFGELNELETQVLNDSDSAQVVFMRSSDARDAFRSLEKSSPFGPALVNYRLHHLSAASVALEPDGNLHKPKRPINRLKTPVTPSRLKPQQGEAPDLSFIRQNLEMMTSMLEKAGDNLSPEMRAKLENEIKGLLKKVSTMVGSSSSS